MRMSPMHDSLSRLGTVWGTLNGMPIARSVPGPADTTLELFDLSALHRTGLKGPGAASWLEARNVAVPQRPNSWLDLTGDGLIARLGRSEFLIEDGLHGTSAKDIAEALAAPTLTLYPSNVYPVLRQDAALMIRGKALYELLAQTCSIDFSSGTLEERTVSMTMMAGIAVTIVDASSAHAAPCFRVWCDGTYGAYLWETLLEIAVELGGGAAGLNAIYPGLGTNGSNESNQP